MYGVASYASPTPSRRRVRLVAAVAVLFVVAGLGGVVVGRATADPAPHAHRSESHDPRLPSVNAAGLRTPHGPTRMRGVLPVGFSDDKAGALSCAAVASETLVDYVQIRRTTSPSNWIATYTTGTLSALSMQKILDWNPALYRLPSNRRPTQLAPRRQAVSVSELVPVGYKVVSFSPSSAHVQLWLHGAGWSSGSTYPNTVVDRSADVELAWSGGDWKIIAYTQPSDQTWDGPALDDPSARGFAPWPGGQFTFVTG